MPTKRRKGLCDDSNNPVAFIGSGIRAVDMFGKPISVNYDGGTSFKTIPGGCCAILMVLVAISYLFIVWKEFHLRERWILN